MTKQHFIALANSVKHMKPTTNTNGHTGTFYIPGPTFDGALRQWEFMRDRLADFCKYQNHAFKRERWLAYIAGECDPNGGELKGGAK